MTKKEKTTTKKPSSRTLSMSAEIQELGNEVSKALTGKKNLSGVVSLLIIKEAKALGIEI